MMELSFTTEGIEQLKNHRFNHPHPRIQMKAEVLLLKAIGIPHGQIAQAVGICENTVRGYFYEYETGGTDGLMETRFYTPVSKLMTHDDEIRAYFLKFPPPTIKSAAAEIFLSVIKI